MWWLLGICTFSQATRSLTNELFLLSFHPPIDPLLHHSRFDQKPRQSVCLSLPMLLLRTLRSVPAPPRPQCRIPVSGAITLWTFRLELGSGLPPVTGTITHWTAHGSASSCEKNKANITKAIYHLRLVYYYLYLVRIVSIISSFVGSSSSSVYLHISLTIRNQHLSSPNT